MISTGTDHAANLRGTNHEFTMDRICGSPSVLPQLDQSSKERCPLRERSTARLPTWDSEGGKHRQSRSSDRVTPARLLFETWDDRSRFLEFVASDASCRNSLEPWVRVDRAVTGNGALSPRSTLLDTMSGLQRAGFDGSRVTVPGFDPVEMLGSVSQPLKTDTLMQNELPKSPP
jgi:hypothetical protein